MKLSFIITIVMYSATIVAQDFAVEQLEASPLHHEWVKVKVGERELECFVVYPETSEKTLSVIIIHENRGLTDWIKSFADNIASSGYVAIAPDLLSGYSETYPNTRSYPTSDAARKAIYDLDAEQVTEDLNAVQQFVTGLVSTNKKTVVIGFCWGGSQAFRFATDNHKIKASFVFYGSAPDDPAKIKAISAPVYGFYGENDERINAGIQKTEQLMKEFKKTYQYEIYSGAGHAYMRRGADPNEDGPNKVAREKSWERLLALLKELNQ